MSPPRPIMGYSTRVIKGEEPTMTYDVKCYSAPYENTGGLDYDRAIDLCYNLSEEYGYAEITEWNGPYQHLIADYTNGR